MSQDLQTRFVSAKENIVKLSKRPAGPALLKLYSLYKQGTEGDCAGSRPGMLQPVERAKYDAWAGLKGTTKDEALAQYCDYAESLIASDQGKG